MSAPAGAVELGTTFSGGIPEVPELTWHGFTLYGVVDVSGQYESRGAPVGSEIYSPQGLISPSNRSPRFLIAPSQEAQSFIGLKTTQAIAYGFSVVAKAEVGFSPTTGRLANALGALQKQDGVPTAQQTAAYDGPRAGQVFNGDLYGGIRHGDYGTITVGRQTTLSFDNIAVYDPLASYGFSLLGYVGVPSGQGGSEEVRVDSSVKYVYNNGIVRGALFFGDPGTGVKTIWQADAGFDYKGVSFDVAGGRARDEINAASLSGTANLGSPFLGARVFDSSLIEVFGRYRHDLSPSSYVAFSAGLEHINFSNPADGGLVPGHATINGYLLGPSISTTGLSGGGIVNYAFTGGGRTLNFILVGLKYQYNEKISVAAAYYRQIQNSFGFGVSGVAPASAPFYSRTYCYSSALANCAGVEEVVSLRADYKYNKNITFYAGSAYSVVENGLAFGYLHTTEVDPTVGLKFAF